LALQRLHQEVLCMFLYGQAYHSPRQKEVGYGFYHPYHRVYIPTG